MACEGRALAQQVACEAFFSFRGRRRRRPASSSFFGCGHRKEKKQTGICSPARSSGCFQAFPLSRGGRIYVLDLYAAVRKERKTQWGEGQLLLPHVKQASERPPLVSLSLSVPFHPHRCSSQAPPWAKTTSCTRSRIPVSQVRAAERGRKRAPWRCKSARRGIEKQKRAWRAEQVVVGFWLVFFLFFFPIHSLSSKERTFPGRFSSN